MAESGGIGGSDEGFISFSFAVTSVVLFVYYIPWMIGAIRKVFLYYSTSKKERASVDNPIQCVRDSVVYIPHVIREVSSDPQALAAGARICLREKSLFMKIILPKFLRFVLRPRVLLLWLWLFLFSSVMYATLTFDAHGILGLTPSASVGDIKKAYRALSKRYHPDQNSTAEARDIYIKVRRAYKSLVDPEAYEQEMRNSQDFSVGVALPRFLTSREHDGIMLIGLLALLIGLPAFLWYRIMREENVQQLVRDIQTDKTRIDRFMEYFGIPANAKFVERRNSRRAILHTLVNLHIVPANAPEEAAQAFPPFPDFIQRCIDVDKNKTYLKGLGLTENHMAVLNTYMTENGVKLLDEYEAVQVPDTPAENLADKLVDQSTYRAARYLLQHHLDQVNQSTKKLLSIVDNNLPSAKRLLNAHEEIVDLLSMLYNKKEKPSKQLILKLIPMSQRVSEIVDSLEPELAALYRRAYKNYVQKAQAVQAKQAALERQK